MEILLKKYKQVWEDIQKREWQLPVNHPYPGYRECKHLSLSAVNQLLELYAIAHEFDLDFIL